MKMFFPSFLLIICAVYSGAAYQLPCDFTLDIGEDINICGSEFVELDASSINATPIDVQWQPSDLFSNANSLTPVAVISESTMVSVRISVLSEVNLVANGDFEQGDQDFTSDYIYGTGGGVGLLSNEGQYAIASNAGDTHDHFDDCTDHTGGGNMMVVNASGLPNRVWCQTITVEPNTEYEFGAWLTSVTSENPAQLQFSINGSILGDVVTASSTTCSWQEFAANWMSDTATTAEICINNVNLTPNGNDFALDDISFKTVCVLEDELMVNVGHADASWTPIADLCEGSTILLSDLLAEEATPGGTWMINGQEVNGSESITLNAGLNQVSYYVTDGICEEEITHPLEVGMERSTGTPGEPLSGCEGSLGVINLFDLIEGEDSGGSWSQSGGSTVATGTFNTATGDLNLSNATPGIYEFTYAFDVFVECHAEPVTITITIASAPIAEAGEDTVLSCEVSSVYLGSDNINSNYNYIWTNLSTGAMIGNDNRIEVSEVGTYQLQVEDTQTGCMATDVVAVLSDIHNLELVAHGAPIGCKEDNNGQIIIDMLSGGSEPYLYSLNDGDFMDDSVLTGLSAGDYHLTVMDVAGCTTETEVSIIYLNELIAVIDNSIGVANPHVALGDSIRLDVNTSVGQDNIQSVSWSPRIPDCDGCFSVYVHPVTMPFETYTATVIDNNGCTATDSITIYVDEVKDVYIPNAFSPNDDGINDIFSINAGVSVEEIEYIQIFNRWGNLVFENKNFQPNTFKNGWNGLANGKPQPTGYYTYILSVKLVDGSSVLQSGGVVLLR